MILIVPEFRDSKYLSNRSLEITESLYKQSPKLPIVPIVSWSIFSPSGDYPNTSLTLLTRGYHALSKSDNFKDYIVYIGYLLKEDFPRIDTIIYESPAAKEIIEEFYSIELPNAKEVIVIGKDQTIENEVFKRTVIYNIIERP